MKNYVFWFAILLAFSRPAFSEACPAAGFYKTGNGYINGFVGGGGGYYMPSYSFERVVRIDSLCNMEFQSQNASGFRETLYRQRGAIQPGKEGTYVFRSVNCGINELKKCDSSETTTSLVVNKQGIMLGQAQYVLLQGEAADSVKTRMEQGPQRAIDQSRFLTVFLIIAVVVSLAVGFGST
jgi:hypothetical protein